jgi:hypothetical protein
MLVFGFNESESIASDISRFFIGNPTDKTVWLMIGGAASIAAGLVLCLRRLRMA